MKARFTAATVVDMMETTFRVIELFSNIKGSNSIIQWMTVNIHLPIFWWMVYVDLALFQFILASTSNKNNENNNKDSEVSPVTV